tara:strand:+ start:742 stop:1413 length:672 start_codon:yes stop_codon:yes gene_type:complete
MNKPITAWSYSRLALFEQCPAKYKYQNIDKLDQPKSPAMFRGIKVHDEIANFLIGKLDAVPESGKKFEDELWELREIDANLVVELKWAFTKDWKPTTWMAGNVRARIILDAGVIYDDGHADVIDHKTGKYYADGNYADQLKLFAGAVCKKYPQVQTITVRLWYLDADKEITQEFTREEALDALLEIEDRADVLLAAKNFPPRANQFCNWCHFRKSNGGPCDFS